MGADLAGTSSPYISPSFSASFNDIFTKWKLLNKIMFAHLPITLLIIR